MCDLLGSTTFRLCNSPETHPGCAWVSSALYCWLVVHTLQPLGEFWATLVSSKLPRLGSLPGEAESEARLEHSHAWYPDRLVSGLAIADFRFVPLHSLEHSGVVPGAVVSMVPHLPGTNPTSLL